MKFASLEEIDTHFNVKSNEIAEDIRARLQRVAEQGKARIIRVKHEHLAAREALHAKKAPRAAVEVSEPDSLGG